ncbi:MAG: response regulator [Thermoplasmatales archaeon]|nr:response regulator [Thermoplasmatales archaeon]
MSKMVMIVDDTKDTVGMVKKLLESEGYETMDACNGKDALELLKKAEEKPDLVLLDMFMPEMSGREVCEIIRDDEDLKDLKVAFFTVAAFRGQGKQMLEDLKVSDYIVKPFDIDDLLKRIRRILEE